MGTELIMNGVSTKPLKLLIGQILVYKDFYSIIGAASTRSALSIAFSVR